MSEKYVVFDFETTGFSAQKNEIIQIEIRVVICDPVFIWNTALFPVCEMEKCSDVIRVAVLFQGRIELPVGLIRIVVRVILADHMV